MIFYSSFHYSYLWLPLIGLIVGLLGSVIGGGGGFFYLPVLILLFNAPAQIAVPTSLAATLPICLVGSYSHHREKNIHWPMGIAFGLSGIVGALSGASITRILSAIQLKICFGVYSIVIALQMLVNQWKEKKAAAKGLNLPNKSVMNKITKGSLYGFLAGIITGTFGTTGSAPVLAGLFSLRMPLKLVVGTSLLIVLFNTFSALAAHFLVGKIDLTLVYFLTSGAIIGAFSGPRLLAGIKVDRAEAPVRRWYALGMIAFGILMIVAK